MNSLAFSIAGFSIYWSSIVITLGIVVAFIITLALYDGRSDDTAAVWVMFPIAFILGFFFSRIIHWYFNAEAYASFVGAFTDYSIGSFCLPGMIIGILLAALIVRKLRLTGSASLLLDCAAPGMCLLIAFIRLSALFNTSCRSKIVITKKWLQFLPIASGMADNSGNVTYRLATFFIEFLIMLVITVMVWRAYVNRNELRMKGGFSKNGNIINLALLLYGVVEIVMDSTRNDSPLMHFRIFSVMNQWSAFISFAQIFAVVCIVVVLVNYSIKSIKSNGFKFYHPLIWVGFLVSAFCIGKLGEYNVQRTGQYLKCYSIMSVSCIVMAVLVYLMYYSCTTPRYIVEKE